MKTGDSEVDGSEVERSGFSGHPMCEFCKSSFYGDNELYTHMSREHYSCHICQRYCATFVLFFDNVANNLCDVFATLIIHRQHPGQYDYFRNYDDLEVCCTILICSCLPSLVVFVANLLLLHLIVS
jgi:E3 ubiquitin-protein ligase ZNF598